MTLRRAAELSLSCVHETPWLRRRGVSGAIAESDLWTVRDFHYRAKVGRSRGHKVATVALKGAYSNRPPDKAVIPE